MAADPNTTDCSHARPSLIWPLQTLESTFVEKWTGKGKYSMTAATDTKQKQQTAQNVP